MNRVHAKQQQDSQPALQCPLLAFCRGASPGGGRMVRRIGVTAAQHRSETKPGQIGAISKGAEVRFWVI